MAEEMTASQEPQEITAPQEQTATETVETPTPQAEAQEAQTSEVEASTDNQEPVEQTDDKPKPIIDGLTYTSQEELVKGVKAKDEYIEKLKTELQAKQQAEQEVYKQLGYQNELQFKNAQVEQQLSQQHQQELNYIEQAYNTDLITLNNALDNGQMSEFDYNNQIAQLQQAKVNYLAEAKANDKYRRSQAAYQAQTAQQQAFEQQKQALKQKYPKNEGLIDLFYDPQPTIEKALAYENVVIQKAVEAYKKSLQAGQENSDAKANLNSSVNVGNPVQADPSIPQTMSAVLAKAEKDPNWYNKNYSKIMAQFG